MFKELNFLLPGYEFMLRFFGLEIAKSANGRTERFENVTLVIHKMEYHRYEGGRPLVAICYNAGLSAYATWRNTVRFIDDSSIPAYITDLSQQSLDLSRTSLASGGIVLSETAINPFRSPLR